MGRIAKMVAGALLLIIAMPGFAFAQAAGTLDYNTGTQRFEFYDGADWHPLNIGLPLGGCADEGVLDFNPVLLLYQYCNGTSWIRIVGTPTLSVCSQLAAMKYESGRYLYCNGVLWVSMK